MKKELISRIDALLVELVHLACTARSCDNVAEKFNLLEDVYDVHSKIERLINEYHSAKEADEDALPR